MVGEIAPRGPVEVKAPWEDAIQEGTDLRVRGVHRHEVARRLVRKDGRGVAGAVGVYRQTPSTVKIYHTKRQTSWFNGGEQQNPAPFFLAGCSPPRVHPSSGPETEND